MQTTRYSRPAPREAAPGGSSRPPSPRCTATSCTCCGACARAEANLALDAWRAAPGREAYTAYRAAEDRADAAQDALAHLAVCAPRHPWRPAELSAAGHPFVCSGRNDGR